MKLFILGLLLFGIFLLDDLLTLPRDSFGNVAQNALHIPAFFAIGVLLGWLFPHRGAIVLVAAGAAIGVSIEIVQIFTPRDASFSDIGLDLLGLSIAMIAVRGRNTGWSGWVVALVALVFVTAAGPVRILAAYHNRDARFPDLLEVGNLVPDPLVSSNSHLSRQLAPAHSTEFAGKKLLSVCWSDVRYPGIQLDEIVGDWRDYSSLVIDLVVPGTDPVQVTLAVGHVGTPGTSAYVSKVFEPGAHHWLIPIDQLTGESTSDRIQFSHLTIHGRQEQAGKCILLVRVHLEA